MLSKKQGNEEGLGKKSAVHLAESLDQGDEEPQGRGCIEEPCVKQKLFAFDSMPVVLFFALNLICSPVNLVWVVLAIFLLFLHVQLKHSLGS